QLLTAFFKELKEKNIVAIDPLASNQIYQVEYRFQNPNDPQLQSDDNDSSDYENLNTFSVTNSGANEIPSISAPGPVNPNDYTFTQKDENPAQALQKELSSLSLKKSVHFRSSANGREVLAETFEYPKCPSENCSCSTRFILRLRPGNSKPQCYSISNTNKIALDVSEPEESQVIRDYKNAIGEQLENSVVKNLLRKLNQALHQPLS
ncbi:Centrosomal protein of 131 kDa, partial [Eumeta japonica]